MRKHNVSCKIEVTDIDKQKMEVCIYANGYYILMIEKILQHLDIPNEKKADMVEKIISKLLSKEQESKGM